MVIIRVFRVWVVLCLVVCSGSVVSVRDREIDRCVDVFVLWEEVIMVEFWKMYRCVVLLWCCVVGRERGWILGV